MRIKRPACIIILLLLIILACENCRLGGSSYRNMPMEESEKPMFSVEESENRILSVEESEHQIVSIEGRVKSKEYKRRLGVETLVVLLETENKNSHHSKEAMQQVMCYMKASEPEPYIGQRIMVRGKVSLFPQATNPGEFDNKEYYQILEISCKLSNTEILLKSKTFSLLEENLYRLKRLLSLAIDSGLSEREAGIMKAMLLGDKSTLDLNVKELYQLSGIIHILAISGVHVSILGMGVYKLLYKCMLPKWLRIPLSVIVMVLYGLMTGMGTSCIRAVFMFGLKLLAELVGRTYDIITALSLIGIAVLWKQPLYMSHSGFMLSFTSVLGLIYVRPWLESCFDGMWLKECSSGGQQKKGFVYRIRRVLCDSTGLSVMIATLPIQLHFYYVYPLTSLFLNLLVIPLMGILLASGTILVVLQLGIICLTHMSERIEGSVLYCIDWISQLFGKACECILTIYEYGCEFSMKMAGGTFVIGEPPWWQILIYYVMVFLMICYPWACNQIEKRRKAALFKPSGFIQGLLLIIALCFLCRNPRENMRVHFLDVGQGDCIVMVNANGNAYMIDGGSTSKSDVGTYQIVPFLKSQGIGVLEAVFLTHPDEDHMSGIIEMLQDERQIIKMKSIILPDIHEDLKKSELMEIRHLAEQREIPVYYMHRGEGITDGDLRIFSLNPREDSDATDINELSQVLHVSYQDFEMLLTGDITGMAEDDICKFLKEKCICAEEGVDVLKVAHHGSKYSTPSELLQIISPKYAVISAGKRNLYGHPHKETLERLSAQGSVILTTSDCGAVTVKVDKKGWGISGFVR